jgi:hypothetical protein
VKIYLASRYSRAHQMRFVRGDLQDAGHTVTSRWINGDHQITDAGLSDEAKAEERMRFAQEDWEDLCAAECVISFTEEPRKTTTRGGRHVEFGGALMAGKRVIVVGWRENVFHCLPQVEFFAGWGEALAALGEVPSNA